MIMAPAITMAVLSAVVPSCIWRKAVKKLRNHVEQ